MSSPDTWTAEKRARAAATARAKQVEYRGPFVLAHPEDVAVLPYRWRVEAVRALRAIKDCPEGPRGYDVTIWEPREWAVGLDALRGCLCLRFGPDGAYRVVYRLTEHGCEVLAVGLRAKSDVYRLAVERLEPRPQPRRVRPVRHVRPHKRRVQVA